MTKTNEEIIQELVDAERLKVAAMTDWERAVYYDDLTARQRAAMVPYTPGPRQAVAAMPETLVHRLPTERLASYTDDQLLEELKRRKIVRTVECTHEDLIDNPESERGKEHMAHTLRSAYRRLADEIAHAQANGAGVPRGGAVFHQGAVGSLVKVKTRAVLHVLY